MPTTRIDRTMAELKAKGERALVVYLTAGDPSIEETARVALALAEAGADILEIGMPFSDPVADGPTIQEACQRSLAAGTTPEGVFRLIERIRSESDVAIAIMTYVNLVHRKGYKAFAGRAARAGADGILVTDLPAKSGGEWLRECHAVDLNPIFLIAPTSSDETIRESAEAGGGFLYCVSRAGTTGARASLPPELPALVARVRALTSDPICVGFGIATPEHVRAVTAYADGAIVGSAMVDLVHRTPAETRVEAASAFCRALKEGTKSPLQLGEG
jgi:tryptophan synthase alpha chain